MLPTVDLRFLHVRRRHVTILHLNTHNNVSKNNGLTSLLISWLTFCGQNFNSKETSVPGEEYPLIGSTEKWELNSFKFHENLAPISPRFCMTTTRELWLPITTAPNGTDVLSSLMSTAWHIPETRNTVWHSPAHSNITWNKINMPWVIEIVQGSIVGRWKVV